MIRQSAGCAISRLRSPKSMIARESRLEIALVRRSVSKNVVKRRLVNHQCRPTEPSAPLLCCDSRHQMVAAMEGIRDRRINPAAKSEGPAQERLLPDGQHSIAIQLRGEARVLQSFRY